MVVFSGKQVFPVDYEAEVSKLLLEASLSGDLKSALECIADPFVDVNFVDAVCLKTRKTEVVLGGESESEVRVDYEEFKTDVTALFVAVHTGNVSLVKKLLSIGADVNQKLFRGFATTAAVREGHYEILEILLKDGASQPACEEALLEASCHGRGAKFAELLMASDLIRPHVAVHALVTACCRGFVDLADALIKCGADASATDRVLLQSSRPSLHANVDCTALVAAVVSRQISVVRLLLQAGARTDIKVKLGAWSWDTSTGEECRVGAGLAEPYPITWCAVEYFESSGAILRMLLQQLSLHSPHCGRTLLHHAILCGNAGAVSHLLSCGADVESPVKTTGGTMFRPIHMAGRLGYSAILQCLIDFGCDINSKTDIGDTALMICARYKQDDCLRVLAMAGADFGLINADGQSVSSISGSNMWFFGFQLAVVDVIKAGKLPRSSNLSVFSPLISVAQAGDTEALKALMSWEGFNVDYQDDNGFSAVMITALKGHVEAFRLLVYAGADVKLANESGETAITLSESNQNRDLFEKVMLEFALEKGNGNAGGFYALHYAARQGDSDAVKLLTGWGYDVNVPDGDGYTPLMLAAREGHSTICQLLISHGANIKFKNERDETALSLARKNGGKENEAECILLDELARNLVIGGGRVQKHTKGGKGSPHAKEIRMVGDTGILHWGKSSRRNVICRDAALGPSQAFRRNRKTKGDADQPGLFRIVTNKNQEVHFVCEGGREAAELWVSGIKLVTKEAVFG
ncbi:hypothetical protein L484_017635 [Morus notabilis]|uniref:Uncharacterized protein n=1 Tax=Morus notabilis TaxID=981085 RepID=W9S8E5_9ROSA|nr:ankyrin-3 [Morus notabilis]EXC31354.1 hypothetical protein L484_017635 [Morus notabilis]